MGRRGAHQALRRFGNVEQLNRPLAEPSRRVLSDADELARRKFLRIVRHLRELMEPISARVGWDAYDDLGGATRVVE